MITIVIIINVAIALCCLYMAYYLWQIRCALAETARIAAIWEYHTRQALAPVPNALSQGQTELLTLRQQYQQIYPQLQRARQLLALLGFLGSVLWANPRLSQPDRPWRTILWRR